MLRIDFHDAAANFSSLYFHQLLSSTNQKPYKGMVDQKMFILCFKKMFEKDRWISKWAMVAIEMFIFLRQNCKQGTYTLAF